MNIIIVKFQTTKNSERQVVEVIKVPMLDEHWLVFRVPQVLRVEKRERKSLVTVEGRDERHGASERIMHWTEQPSNFLIECTAEWIVVGLLSTGNIKIKVSMNFPLQTEIRTFRWIDALIHLFLSFNHLLISI